MASDRVEMVQTLVDRWNSGDRAVHPDLFHPDIEFLPARSATEGAFLGYAGLEKFLADTAEVFDKFEFSAMELEDVGDQVLAWGTIHVRGAGGGVETDIATAGLFDFRDGKIVRWKDYGSKDAALAAA